MGGKDSLVVENEAERIPDAATCSGCCYIRNPALKMPLDIGIKGSCGEAIDTAAVKGRRPWLTVLLYSGLFNDQA